MESNILYKNHIDYKVESYDSREQVEIESLIGEIIKDIAYDDETISFITDKNVFKFEHLRDLHRNCYELVYLQDIIGDLSDLIDSPITLAECRTNELENGCLKYTLYHLVTIKGRVDIRFNGFSNGHYSMDVDITKMNLVNTTEDEYIKAKVLAQPTSNKTEVFLKYPNSVRYYHVHLTTEQYLNVGCWVYDKHFSRVGKCVSRKGDLVNVEIDGGQEIWNEYECAKIVASTNTELEGLPKVPESLINVALDESEMNSVHIHIQEDGTINIKPPKENWNRDEVIQLMKDLADHIDDLYRGDTRRNVRGYTGLPEWLEKNL